MELVKDMEKEQSNSDKRTRRENTENEKQTEKEE